MWKIFKKKIKKEESEDALITRLFPTYYLYPIIELKDEKNLSEGEVQKFNISTNEPIGYQLVEPCRGGYDRIWRHIGRGYYKCTLKTKESEWSCQ